MRTIRSFAWLVSFALPISSFGSIFQVVQLSEPAGFLSQTDAIQQGINHPSVNPTLSSNGYAFGYWTINDIRIAGPDGRSLTQVSSDIQAASTYKAHYFQESTDSDSDGIMDWFEYRMFGDLSRGPGDDPDGDGFTNQREDQLAQDPLVKDLVWDGGISSRTSTVFVYADTSMVKATIKSDPAGFVTQSENFLALNSNVSTASLNGETNGYHFAYWSVNGVRQAAPNGTASSQVDMNVSVTSEIVAHYLPSNEDSDSDGVMDWFELNQFGSLTLGPNDDPDGDGFPNKQEGELGQEARIKDLVRDGGLSSRTSTAFVYADTSMVQATIRSDPAGFVTQSENYLALNANVSTASLNGETNGYHFAYWSVNGVRQTAPNGTSASQVDMNLTATSQIVAHYLLSNEDSDSDGVMDWFELHQFGNLSLGPDDDPDGDGFSNMQEGELGQEARIKDFVRDGGLSSRTSPSILYFLQVNNPPDGLDLNDTIVLANKPAGELVGIFQPSDPDDPSGQNAYQLSFLEGNGSTDKNLFTISGMNLLSVASLQVGNYSVNVRVSDDENASLEKVFHIQAIHDPNKDDDNDGLTYAQEQALGTSDSNIDSDGDGFSDPVEIAYGSDPANASSIANAPPSALQASSTLSIYENLPIWTIIGEFNATDPDADSALVFSLVDGNGSQGNPFFNLDKNGSLSSAVIFDYENNASNYPIRVKVTDEHNASLEKAFTISLLNEIEDLDGDGIEDFYDADDDGDGFSDANEIAYGSDPRDPDSVANAAPSNLNLNGSGILENQPIDAVVGVLQGIDQDANASLSYFLVDGNGSIENSLFNLDANGTLSSAVIFDYEQNASNYSIRVRVTDEHNAYLEKAFAISLLNELEDLDGDGIEDFYDADDDGDGFSDISESAYGSDPRDAGSVANSAPSDLVLNDSGILENQPIGTIIGLLQGSDPDANASLYYFLVDGNGSIDNALFSLDENGSLSSAVTFDYENNQSNYSIRVRVIDEHNASLEKVFVISLLNEIEDLDEDGSEDFYDFDDDNDGFSDAEEIAYGSDPRDAHSVANAAPSDLNLNGSGILENQPIGTIIGLTEGIDPDANASLSYSLVDGNGSIDNILFSVDANGSLSSAVVFDFENNESNYSIRVRVTDEHNASLEKAFTISLLNEIEDLDGDGIEDFYDADDDNDGFSDANEIAYGSDPMDAYSVANAAPSSLELNGSVILENQPIGSMIGLLQGSDPDVNASLSYSLVDGNGSMENSLFNLDANRTLSSAVIFDYETNVSNYFIRVRVTDEHNAYLEKTFAISLLNEIEDLDGDGVEDFYDADDDNDAFSDAKETAYGSDPRDADSVANAAPSDLNLNGSAILENQSIGAVVGLLQGIDPDANAALSYFLVDGNGSIDNPLFSLDENGTLRSAVLFDYENNQSNYSIRVRVTDEHNASLETVFAIRVLDDPSDDLLPWVRGLNLHFDENGTPTLSFEAGTEHGAELLETGILLTFAGAQQRFPADLNGNGDPYLVSLDGLQPGQTYRYRAYARNQVGETLSAMGKLSIEDDSSSSPWWVETDSDGWVRDSWIGSFLPTENGWLFHSRLGWIYAQQDEVGGLWIWLKEEGWLWSRADLFPFLYSNDRGNWLYLLPTGSPLMFLDYAIGSAR